MKKIIGICICFIMLVAAIVAPSVAFAAETTAGGNGEVIINFLNPTAIAYVNGKLLVADNIDESNSAIHCFDVSDNDAKWLYTEYLTERIVNLSAKEDDSLYVVFADKIVEYSASNTELTATATISGYTNAVDVAYGADGSDKNEYILTATALYRKGIGGTVTTNDIAGAKGCIAIGNYVYYLYVNENPSVDICKNYEGVKHATPNDDSAQGYLNKSENLLSEFDASGLFVWESDKVALFSSTKIVYINMSATCSLVDVFDYQAQQGQSNKEIVDVVASTDRMYILNSNYQVDVYQKSGAGFDLIATIGDDTVNQTVPTQFTSFTLARPTSYPTNLIYKTNDADTTVDEIVKNATEYIILGFDGEENSNYYYVLVGNKFGWVQKSDGATSAETDANLKVVNTAVNSDSNVEYKTRFSSLNAVYLHKLPREAFPDRTITQSQTNPPIVTLLQQFTEQTDDGEIVWYYVCYEEGGQTLTGFVKKAHVYDYYIEVKPTATKIGNRKINSTLFEAVKVYDTPDRSLWNELHLALSPDGNTIKLYSGQRVELISEDNGVALIQIKYADGTVSSGYISSNRLIGVHGITTNAIVGLCALAVAIGLGTALIVIFVKRRKRNSPKRKKERNSEI